MPIWGLQRQPLVIAHRGASADFPENTIAAFRHAETLGADAIELDVMRCATGEVIVFHDDDLRRLTGRPECIRHLPLAALREVTVRGEPVPTLDEVIDSVSPLLLINIELKSRERRGVGYVRMIRDDGLAEAVARLVARRGIGPRVLISSFDPLQLRRFRRSQPFAATGLLYHSNLVKPLREAWLARMLRATALHPESRLVNARRVAAAHAAGRAVNVWTVDDPREMAFFDALGVDGIITNRPDIARAALAVVNEDPDERARSAETAHTVS